MAGQTRNGSAAMPRACCKTACAATASRSSAAGTLRRRRRYPQTVGDCSSPAFAYSGTPSPSQRITTAETPQPMPISAYGVKLPVRAAILLNCGSCNRLSWASREASIWRQRGFRRCQVTVGLVSLSALHKYTSVTIVCSEMNALDCD